MARSRIFLVLSSLCFATSAAWAQFHSLRATDLRTKTPDSVEGDRKDWGADLGFGGIFNRGNTDVDYINGSADLFKSWKTDTAYLDGGLIYNTFNGIKTLNQGTETARYDHPLSDHGPWKIFAFDTNAYNYFIALNYRSTSGAGPWYDFSWGKTRHSVSVALAYEYEAFRGGIYRRTGRLSWRDISKFPISDTAEIDTDFFYVPSLAADGNFRIFADVAVESLVYKQFLGLRLTWTDEYESRPVPGIKPNDTIWLTSLRVHLGK